ncbi:hypothetical protein P7C73_g4290, partial [Tremellales sp. Uapishka_1]
MSKSAHFPRFGVLCLLIPILSLLPATAAGWTAVTFSVSAASAAFADWPVFPYAFPGVALITDSIYTVAYAVRPSDCHLLLVTVGSYMLNITSYDNEGIINVAGFAGVDQQIRTHMATVPDGGGWNDYGMASQFGFTCPNFIMPSDLTTSSSFTPSSSTPGSSIPGSSLPSSSASSTSTSSSSAVTSPSTITPGPSSSSSTSGGTSSTSTTSTSTVSSAEITRAYLPAVLFSLACGAWMQLLI